MELGIVIYFFYNGMSTVKTEKSTRSRVVERDICDH